MPSQGCLLLQSGDSWLAAAVGAGAFVEPLQGGHAEIAEQLAEFAARHSLSRSVLIAVGSSAALCGEFEASPADQRNRRALSFQLESSLPLSAEEIVADYVCSGSHVLGVCLGIERWLPLVIELESCGMRVQSISPAALLALQGRLRQGDLKGLDVVLWQDGSHVELLQFSGPAVTRWLHLPADPQAVAQQLAVASLQRPAEPWRAALINVSDEVAAAIAELQLEQLECLVAEAAPVAQHAAELAEAVLSGSEPPWIELRREELAAGDPHRAVRGSLRMCLAAAALLLATLSVGLGLKAWQHSRQLRQLETRQQALFQEAFPESRAPAAIVARLRSEHAKLQGARGASDEVALPTPALHVLFELLSTLPSQERLHVRELRIENGQVDLELQLREHASVNVVVEALEQRGFAVTAPSTTRQNEKMVSSRVFATLQPAAGPEATP